MTTQIDKIVSMQLRILVRIEQTGDKHPGPVNLCADILELIAIESATWINDDYDIADVPTFLINTSRVLRKRAKELSNDQS